MTEVVTALVGKVVDYLCRVAKTEISYIWNSSENVKNLKNEIEQLSSMKGRVQQQIDLAKSKGECILKGVEEWIKKADVEISDDTEFIVEEAKAKKTCLNLRLCVNLSTLLQFSKTATKRTFVLQQHQKDGKEFETRVSLPAPTLGFTDLYRRKSLENIDTQKSALNKIIEAIEDDKIQIVGINGLGGVGKTTLASEVAAEMKNQFAEIVFVTVSRTVDAEMIQEKVEVVAHRIINGEKVLIILDDVWEELKLEDVGIPCGSDNMNCKILVTSRSKDVCEAMNAQKNISVNPLQDEEAWTLFERVVGKTEWDGTLNEVAMNIVKECGGLPLFIQAVGKALKNKEYRSWEATLDRLQDPTDEDALFKRNGIMQLKLSYDYLESEVAKSCFLLCSMFPEDGTIGFKRLTYYCLGLGIVFNDHDSNIQGAKYKVQLAVDSLKSSFLLLPDGEEEGEELFKMHDLVRDMARLITSKGNDKFWVESEKRLRHWQPKKHLESYKKISLMENRICELHDHDLVFPHLDTFLIQDNNIFSVADEFFRGMEKLKVLDMSCNYMPSLPRSLKKLTLLRMLDLSGNQSLNEISILGELTCLEILKLRKTSVTNIPKEIGKLTNLRLLDVYSCEDLSYVTPGVISKLIKLEELYVGLSESNCNFLLELNESLKILHLQVPELLCIPEDFHFETLTGFLIEDDFFNKYPIYDCKRILRLTKSNFPLTMRVMKLIQASECLILSCIKELDNVLPYLYLEGCDKLKYIEVETCDDVSNLVKTCDQTYVTSDGLGQRKVFSKVENIWLYSLDRLELIWDRPLQYISFCNLRSFTIWHCPSLLTLFPLSVAQGLVSLRDIDINNCKSLSVVISAGDEGTTGSETELVDTSFMFPLTNIKLVRLPKLESFYSGHSIIKYPSLKNLSVKDCSSMKRWSYGENHIPNIRFEHEGRPYSNINEYINEVQHETDGNLIIWKWSWDDTNKDLFRARERARRRQDVVTMVKSLRTEAQVIRAAYLFEKAGEVDG